MESPKCLLLKTNEMRGSFWQPVTGTVEPGEGYFEAACREPVEETGFIFDAIPIDAGYEFEFTSQFGVTRERVFVLSIDGEPKPTIDSKEHQDFLWTTPQKALTLVKYESNLEGLKKCYKLVYGREISEN